MSRLPTRCVATLVRWVIRRRDWGPPSTLVRRARRLFGWPTWLRWWPARGLDVSHDVIEGVPSEWVAPRPAPEAMLLYLHGGGYVAGSPVGSRPVTCGLARRIPARVLVPDYRLAPEHPFPAAVDDAEHVYRALLDQGIASDTISLAGDSAGGGLVLALLLRLRDEGVPLPASAVLFSPWTDLTGSGGSVKANDGRCDMFRPENIADFALCYAPEDRWTEPLVSPLFGRLDGLPPLHIQVGRRELLLDDAVRVHEGVRAAGGTSQLQVYDHVFHGWQMFDGVLPAAADSLERAAGFLQGP